MDDPTDAITLQSRVTPNPNVFLREEEDEAGILYDPDTGSVGILNATAVEVWKLLDGHREVAQVIGALQEIFDSMDEPSETQVLQLLREFYRLVQWGHLMESACLG
jgi:hypothetical protein